MKIHLLNIYVDFLRPTYDSKSNKCAKDGLTI